MMMMMMMMMMMSYPLVNINKKLWKSPFSNGKSTIWTGPWLQ